MKRLIAVVALLSLTPGCYRVVIDTPASSAGMRDETSGASFLGLTTVTANARDCKHGVAKAETHMPAWGVILQIFTGGLVSGMTAEYYCAAPGAGVATEAQQ